MGTFNRRRALLIAALLTVAGYWIGLIFYFGLMPYPPSLTGLSVDSESALEHIATHFVLGALVYLLLTSVSRGGWRDVPLAFLIAVVLGGSLEAAQALVPERQTSLTDLLNDALGAAAGVALVAAVRRLGIGYYPTLIGAILFTLVAGVAVTAGAAVALAARPHTIDCNVDTFVSAQDAPQVTGRPLPATGRQSDGLVALYDFRRDSSPGMDNVVQDVSGVEPALDLDILNASQARWLSGSNGVELLDDNSAISSQAAARKVYGALTASGQFTIEIWAAPSDIDARGPARIVSMSDGISDFVVNFHIGQSGRAMSQRLRTLCSAFNWSEPRGVFAAGDTAYQLVTTYDGLRQRAYVDGALFREPEVIGGDLSNWDEGYPLLVGNETSLNRGFTGRVYLLAIYDRALSDEEIGRNYEVGPSGAVASD